MLILAVLSAFATPSPDPHIAPMPRPARGWAARHTFTHKAPVTAVTATADAFVTGDKDGVLLLWDAKTGKLRETLLDGNNEQMRPIDLVRPSADGKRLNISSRERATIAQYILAGKDRGLYGPLFGFPVLAARADGTWLVRQGDEQVNASTVEFSSDGSISFSSTSVFSHPEKVLLAAINGETVATVDAKGGVRRWFWTSGSARLHWSINLKLDPTAVAVSPDQTMVAVAGATGTVEVLGAEKGKPLATLKGHTGAVRAVTFAPDSGLIVTGGEDGTVRLWNPWTGEQEEKLSGHSGPVSALWFGSDEVLVSASEDKTARVWVYKP